MIPYYMKKINALYDKNIIMKTLVFMLYLTVAA